MMTSFFTLRLRRYSVALVGLLLFASCERRSTEPAAEAEAVSRSGPVPTLGTCDEPELKPLEDETAQVALPVAYPAAELRQPIRVARALPLADPNVALPKVELPRSIVREVRPLPDEPARPVPGFPPLAGGRPLAVAPQAPPASTPLGPPQVSARFVSQSPRAVPGRPASARPRFNPPAQPPAQPPVLAPRSVMQPQAMRAVTLQAEQAIRRGYHLAERGALYSARAEFIQALRMIAQALDLQAGSREHTQALAAGLTALEEAEDFIPEGSRLEADLDVATLVRAHRTPVCKEMDAENLLPVVVLQNYYTYAQEQLALAASGEEAASMALFGLGKTYGALATEKSLSAAVAEPKAMVFHWAALTTHAGNFLAANELAVLEAHWGQYTTARSLLRYSLAVLPHSTVWRNLAVVHRQLGEPKLAELALVEADVAAKREAAVKPGNPEGIVPSSDVEWLDAQSFAATSRAEIDPQKPATQAPASGVKATPVVAPAPPRHRSAAAWFRLFR